MRKQQSTMYEDGLPPLREVISHYALNARKSLGQNFLTDLNLTGRIARSANAPGASQLKDSIIYEVGPGPGALTRGLLMNGAHRIIAVETDDRCIHALKDIQAAYPGRLEVIHGDALKMDECQIIANPDNRPIKIIANLPYNIGTALLVKWLTLKDWLPWYSSLTLMFQKEVGLRIIAVPDTKAYGRLSVLGQYRATAKIMFDVPARAFIPPPRITSCIVTLIPKKERPGTASQPMIERVVYAAFNQRRKMVRTSLKTLGIDPLPALTAADIAPTCRAGELTVADFCRLAKIIEDHYSPIIL